MNAGELFKAGKLQRAIEEQTKEVKANPADHSRRLFLFELLAFAGDLDKAGRQIEAITYDEMELEAAVLAYRRLIEAERHRRRVFQDGVAPKFFTDPPEHVQSRLEAVNRLRENRPAEAAKLLKQASTPPLQGQLNDKPFHLLRDCDDLFGPVLEVMAHGSYYWLPLEAVESLTMKAPQYPRDLLWIPARLELKEGSAGEVYLPALYPESYAHSDDQIKLGRATDWKSSAGGPVQGLGARTFLVDDDAVGLLEWRQLSLT